MTHTNRDAVVFVFAHQDDEYAAFPWIESELASGAQVECVYLTDGASRCDAHVRDQESLEVLSRTGIARTGVTFLEMLGGGRVGDGKLVYHIGEMFSALDRRLASDGSLVRLYVPDWEGGHPDHDAAHIIASACAGNRPGLKIWAFSIYNAYRCPRPLFRSLSALPWRRDRNVRHSLAKGLRLAMLCWNYPSQRRTWLGLFPGAFWQRAIRRKEYLAEGDVSRLAQRPHPGELLYERFFNISYERFEAAAQPHIHRLLEKSR